MRSKTKLETLLGALRTLPDQMHSDLPAGAVEGGWERWGIHGRELERSAYTAGRAHVVSRVQAAVAKSGTMAA
jgi:hypothetical protein